MKSDALKQYVALSKALHEEKAQLEARLHELNQILGTATNAAPVAASIPASTGGKKRTMSAAGRARIIAAQKARWAKYNASRGVAPAKPKGKRKMSASAKARIAAAQRARWAAFRAAKG